MTRFLHGLAAVSLVFVAAGCGFYQSWITEFNDVAFSPDGEFLAAEVASTLTAGFGDDIASKDYILLWHPRTGQIRSRLSVPDGDLLVMAFTPDGGSLVSVWGLRTGYSESWQRAQITVWDVATGVIRSSAILEATDVEWLSFSPDTSLLVGQTRVSDSRRTGVTVWDARSGRALHSIDLVGAGRPLFAPDGRSVVIDTQNYTLSADGKAQLPVDVVVNRWDFQTGRTQSAILRMPSSGGASIAALFRDGQRALVTGPWQRPTPDTSTLTVWDLTRAKVVNRYTKARHTRLALSPDDRVVVSFATDRPKKAGASWSTTVETFDVVTGVTNRRHTFSDFAHGVAFSRDSRMLAFSQSETVCVWNLSATEPSCTLKRD